MNLKGCIVYLFVSSSGLTFHSTATINAIESQRSGAFRLASLSFRSESANLSFLSGSLLPPIRERHSGLAMTGYFRSRRSL